MKSFYPNITLTLSTERWALNEGRALADLPPVECAMLKELACTPTAACGSGGSSCGSGGVPEGGLVGPFGGVTLKVEHSPDGFLREAGELSADGPCCYV